MSLYVDIKKSLWKFQLNIQLETENEILALLGASGCGKSMTLKCIAGIEKPDEGIILVNGKTLFDSKRNINISPQKRNTGLLFQNYALFPNMTVFQNIGVAIPKKGSRAYKKEYIKGMIQSFQLDGLENHYPHQLSGGQQQRVALSRILASRPKILLLDEPFSALDSYLRWQLEQEISAHLSEFDGTTLFVSHNRDEVYRICDKIAVISNGKAEVTGDKWELFKDPKTYAGCLLTGCKNISPAVKTSEHTIRSLDWGLEFYSDKIVGDDIGFVGIRAKELELVESLDEPNSFSFEIVKEIQDTFTYILMIRPLNKTDAKPLRWEVSKTMYEEIIKSPKFAKISIEKILLLIE